MLQQISRYSDLARQHKGEYNYIEMLGERVELASKTAQALFDRVTSAILQGSADHSTLMVGLTTLQNRYQQNVPLTLAGMMLATIPVVVAYAFGQRSLVRGLTAGAVKG